MRVLAAHVIWSKIEHRRGEPSPNPLPEYRARGPEIDDDDLPRPGKVWDGSGPSLAELLKQHESTDEPTTVEPVGEPAIGEPALAGGIVQSANWIVQPKPDPNVESVEPADLPRTWQRLLDILSKKGPGIPSILSHGELKSIDGGKATIQFSSPTFAAMLDRNGKKDVIRDELSKLLEQPVGVAIEVSEVEEAVVAPVAPRQATPLPSRAPARAQNQPVMQSVPVSTGIRITPELKESLREKNPLIAGVMMELGGEIVKVE